MHEGKSNIVQRLLDSNFMRAEWVLYFLLVLLASSILIMLWKAAFFTLNAVRARVVRAKVAALVAGGDIAAFQSEVEDLKGVEASVLNHALRYNSNGAEVVDQQMAVALVSGKTHMELGLTFLGTVGSNAPFIGLFGTVLGVIKAFKDLSLQTTDGAAAVMAGISEALVATAVGLVVAIPAVVAFNYLNRQVKNTMNSSNALNEQVLFRLRASEER